jgi:hypothetical protein
MILAALHRAPDEARLLLADHLLHLPWQPGAACRKLCRRRCCPATARAFDQNPPSSRLEPTSARRSGGTCSC